MVEKVMRQFTQGVFPLRLDTAVWVAFPVKVKVNEQSGGVWARIRGTAKAKIKRGNPFLSVVMPLIVRLI